jgi:hypothetical protein
MIYNTDFIYIFYIKFFTPLDSTQCTEWHLNKLNNNVLTTEQQ